MSSMEYITENTSTAGENYEKSFQQKHYLILANNTGVYTQNHVNLSSSVTMMVSNISV